jgi:hypothetical protein
MSPHYTQKRHKDCSAYRISYYRCTKTMHHNNQACTIKHLNADTIERTVVQFLIDLSRHADFVSLTTEALNRDHQEKARPLKQEAIRLSARLDELEREIGRFIQALGQGTITVKRLDQEVQQREQDKAVLLAQYEAIQEQVREQLTRDFDADIVIRHLQDFEKVFHALTPQEQREVLSCLVHSVQVHPDKWVFHVFELPEYITIGSQLRKDWLPGQDSNLRTLRCTSQRKTAARLGPPS